MHYRVNAINGFSACATFKNCFGNPPGFLVLGNGLSII